MKICLVDDDIQLSKALKLSLQDKGYAVEIFNDPQKGLAHLKMNNADYDLIILDWIMPDLSGLEVCKELRAAGVTTRILMVTGVDIVEKVVEALDAGADDYITKPFQTIELLARIRALQRRPKEARPVTITVGDISLNAATHKVFVGTEEVSLTLKEFAILEYLMQNHNQVVGRDQILDNVWDSGFVSFSNIIDVRINSLRNKLGPKGKNTLKTVRGIGYKLEPTKT